MEAMQRIKLTIGDLLVQLAIQAEKIEQLEAKLKKFEGEIAEGDKTPLP